MWPTLIDLEPCQRAALDALDAYWRDSGTADVWLARVLRERWAGLSAHQ